MENGVLRICGLNSALLVNLPEYTFNLIIFVIKSQKEILVLRKQLAQNAAQNFDQQEFKTLFVNHEHANWFEHISISSWKSTWCYEYKVMPGQIMSKGSKQSVRWLDSRAKAAKPDNSKAMAKLNRKKIKIKK